MCFTLLRNLLRKTLTVLLTYLNRQSGTKNIEYVEIVVTIIII